MNAVQSCHGWGRDGPIISRDDVEAVLGVLVRHAWLICAILFVAIGCTGLVVILVRPIYSATALVVIDPMPGVLADGEAAATPYVPGNAEVDGAVELMRSEPVLRHALDRLTPKQTADLVEGWTWRLGVLRFFRAEAPAFPSGEAGKAQALKIMRRAVAVHRRGLTPVIAISAQSVSPSLAAHLANSLAQAHIEREVAAKAEALRDAQAKIVAQAQVEKERLVRLDLHADRLLHEVASLARRSGETGEGLNIDQFALLEDQITARSLLVGEERHRLALGSLAGAVPADRLALFHAAEAAASKALDRYQALLQRADVLEAQAGLQWPDARIAALASAPRDAVFPDARTALGLAGLFGLVVALLVAFGRDRWSNGVRSASELAVLAGAPFAVAIPQLGPMRFAGTSHADLVVRQSASPFAESLQALKVNLLRVLPPQVTGQVVLVTSPGDGEGKTTTALGLARALDGAGHRVLLLDADVRSAALHKQLDMSLNGSFEQVLSGAASPSAIGAMVRRDPLSGVSILSNARPSHATAEQLFGTAAFAHVLRGARASFDITLIDMPSMRWAAETAFILPFADAVVLVARWGRTQSQQLDEAMTVIRQTTGANVSVVPALSHQPAPIGQPALPQAPGYSSA